MLRMIWGIVNMLLQPAQAGSGGAPPPPASDYLLADNGVDILTNDTGDRLLNG